MPFDVNFFIFILRASKIISTSPGAVFLENIYPCSVRPNKFFYEYLLNYTCITKNCELVEIQEIF